jgi:hypothetical protein
VNVHAPVSDRLALLALRIAEASDALDRERELRKNPA